MPLIALLATLVCCFQSTSYATSTDGAFPLPLSRPIKVTDTYLLKGMSTQISRVTTTDPNGVTKVMQDDTAVVNIDAMCEVAGVTEDGQEAVKLVTIRNAQLRRQGEVTDLVPTGTSLKATFTNEGTEITKDGVPVPMEVMVHLVNLIRGEGGSRTGAMMDPPGPVAVGASWPMDSTTFLNMLGDLVSKQPASVSGSISFTSVDSAGVRPDAVVVLTAHAVDAIGSLGQATPTSSSIVMNITVHAPLDTRYPLTATNTFTRLATHFGSGPGSAHVESISTVDLQFLR